VTIALIAPALITIIGLFLVVVAARRAAEEAVALHRSVNRLGDLRPAVIEVRDDLRAFRAQASSARLR
jgi:UPF0716 family protein affecting phage T7 exclusion